MIITDYADMLHYIREVLLEYDEDKYMYKGDRLVYKVALDFIDYLQKQGFQFREDIVEYNCDIGPILKKLERNKRNHHEC